MANHFQHGGIQYDNYSTNNMDPSYKAIMSVLDDSIKKTIHLLFLPDKKYGPILWIRVL